MRTTSRPTAFATIACGIAYVTVATLALLSGLHLPPMAPIVTEAVRMHRAKAAGVGSEIVGQLVASVPVSSNGLARKNPISGKVENAIAPKIPWLLGGAADLAPSTKTLIAKEHDFEAEDYSVSNFHFGIREHGDTSRPRTSGAGADKRSRSNPDLPLS